MRSRVLVVDDDPALAEMLTIVLRGEGFDAAVVRDETGKGVLRLRQRPETLNVSLPFMALFRNM